MRQPILTDCFQKVHPKKCGDLHLMNPTNFPIPVRMRMVGGDFYFIKIGGLKVLHAADIVEIYKMAK